MEVDVVDNNGIFGKRGKDDDYQILHNLPEWAKVTKGVTAFDDVKQLSAIIARPDLLESNKVYSITFISNKRTGKTGKVFLNLQLSINYKYLAAMMNGYSEECDILDTIGVVHESSPQLTDYIVNKNYGDSLPDKAIHGWYYFLAANTDNMHAVDKAGAGINSFPICWNDEKNPNHDDSGLLLCDVLFTIPAGSEYGSSKQASADAGIPAVYSPAPSSSSKNPAIYIQQLYIKGGKTKLSPGSKDEVCAVVSNKGKEPKDDVKVIFERSDGKKVDTNPKEIGKENIKHKNLEKNETKTECTDFQVPDKPGEYFNIRAYAKFDGKKAYSEPIILKIKEQPKLDLYQLKLLDRNGNEASIFSSGDPMIAKAWVRNTGGDLEKDVKVSFKVFDQNDRLVASGLENVRDYNLEKNEKKTETHLFYAPDAPGTYSVEACVDPENKIDEKNEADNCLESDFQIVP